MNTDQALALLEWYAEAGVDEAVDERPHDRFSEADEPAPAPRREAVERAPQAAPPPPRPQPSARPAPANPPAAASAAGVEARAMAAAATTLAELEQAVEAFDGCALKKTAKNTCFSDGSPDGRIMFIGEAPGRDEDIQGKPFVGRAGQLLDLMLAAIGLDRTRAYITNVVYWRPPGNRTPTADEIAACEPFTHRQIELVDPAVLVFVGGASAKHMFQTSDGIMRLRGKWRTYELNGRDYRAIATLHPAYLLRQPAHKKLAWGDFLMIRKALEELAPTVPPADEAD